ncbi:MAG TPA: DNA-directed RNA polymerase subunit alpha C-terminal domain-containing protein [Gemmataceae bacterium]|nr:DNA-directed RNA polymerase subunit alpha C-terminal domain-containing protein [Gemmataceae bacterium]
MRVAQGGTKMYCPHCGHVRVCEAISTTQLGKPSGQRWYRKGHEDLQWFRRGRRCQTCRKAFITAEVDEDFLDELVELRTVLAQIKANAEAYVKESKAASEALSRLTASLGVLRALKIYGDAPNPFEMSIAELELSVRATNCLESEGITTVSDLCNHSPDDLLEIRNFGETALAEVRNKLAEHGLRLRGE